MFIEIVVLGQY